MAQSTGGTNLVANTQATSRTIASTVKFKWDGASFTDETSNLLNLIINRQLSSPGAGRAAPGANVTSTATITLHNPSGRYSPLNSSGALFSDIGTNLTVGTEVEIELGYNDVGGGGVETLTRFTGFVTQPGLLSSLTPTVSFTCKGREFVIDEHRTRTTLQENKFPHQFIETLLDDASIAGGDQNLDIGFHRVPWVWAEGENTMHQCQLLAEADGGFLYVDQDGQINYENNYHWLTDTDHINSLITLEETMYQRFQMQFEAQQLFNRVRVPYKPRRPGPKTTLFTLAELWVVAPSTTVTFNVRLKQAAVKLEALVEDDHYVAVDAAGNKRTGDATITLSVFGQSVDVQVQNTNATYALEIRQFRLDGIPLTGEPTRYFEAVGSSGTISERMTLEVRENDYIQTKAQAEMLANIIVDRSEDPRVTFQLGGVPAIPYLEIGDLVTVDCTNEGVTNVTAFVTGWAERFGPGAVYEMDITCIESSSFFKRASTAYFLIGTDAPAAGTSKRVFY